MQTEIVDKSVPYWRAHLHVVLDRQIHGNNHILGKGYDKNASTFLTYASDASMMFILPKSLPIRRSGLYLSHFPVTKTDFDVKVRRDQWTQVKIACVILFAKLLRAFLLCWSNLDALKTMKVLKSYPGLSNFCFSIFQQQQRTFCTYLFSYIEFIKVYQNEKVWKLLCY